MSKGKVSKRDLDDLDDMIGDLLNDDDDPLPSSKKKISGNTTNKGSAGSKPNLDDDNFYKELSAKAGLDNMSDVSDADPNEMVASLKGLDDMDSALFGGKPPTKPSPLAAGNNMEGTGSAANNRGGTGQIKSKYAANRKDLDESDLLAGLLSDSEQTPRKDEKTSKPAIAASENRVAAEKPLESSMKPKVDEKRLAQERPPTRSGNSAAVSDAPKLGKTMQDEAMFDDEDVLGGMGLDSPTIKKPGTSSRLPADESAGPAKSALDDLLGTGTSVASSRPSTGGNREFVLDDKYKKKQDAEEDFLFGTYQPSAVSTTKNPQKRSVRFEDTENRPRSTPSKPFNMSSDTTMDDWMELSATETNERPRSEGGRSDAGQFSLADWLDSSTPRSQNPSPETNTVPETKTATIPPTDAGNSSMNRTSNTTGASGRRGDDWMGLVGSKSSKNKPSDPLDDFLGLGEEVDIDSSVTTITTPRSPRYAPGAENILGVSANQKGPSTLPWDFGQSKKETASTGKTPPPSAGGKRKSTQLEPSPLDTIDAFLESEKRERESRQAHQPSATLPIPKDQQAPSMFNAAPTVSSIKSSNFMEDTKPSETADAGLGPSFFESSSKPQSFMESSSKPATLRESSKPSKFLDSWQDSVPSAPVSTPLYGATPAIPTGPPPAAMTGPPQAAVPTTNYYQPSPQTAANLNYYQPPPAQPGPATSYYQPPQPSLYSQPASHQPSPYAQPTPSSVPVAPASTISRFLQEEQQRAQTQWEEQQKMLRTQQEQQLKQLRERQEQWMQQQQQLLSQPPPAPLPYNMWSNPYQMPGGFGGMGMMEGEKIFRLEMEKTHLETVLNATKEQHQEEIRFMEQAFKHRLDVMTQSFTKLESSYQDEYDRLSNQHRQTVKSLQQEIAEANSTLHRRLQQAEQDKYKELERIKDLHRTQLEETHREHNAAAERLRRAKEQELEAVLGSGEHARNIRALIGRVGDSAKDLDVLKAKVAGAHAESMSDREIELKERDRKLKVLQDQLELQQRDNAQERARLQGLITKLEMQLTDQTRELEQERFRVRQEESKLKGQQMALEQEKEQMLEMVAHERNLLHREKDKLLDEQKQILGQIAEERRSLGEERARFHLDKTTYQEEAQRSLSKSAQSQAEVEGTVRALTAQREQLADRKQLLEREQLQLEEEKAQVKVEREYLAGQKVKLEKDSKQLEERAREAEHNSKAAESAQAAADSTFERVKEVEQEQKTRLQKIQAELSVLRQKEKQLAEERVAVAREREVMNEISKSILCTNCRTPVKDVPAPAAPVLAAAHTTMDTTALDQSLPRMTGSAQKLFKSLPPGVTSGLMKNVSASLMSDRSIRMWRIAAQKDQAYLQEESMYLQALQHTPYHAK